MTKTVRAAPAYDPARRGGGVKVSAKSRLGAGGGVRRIRKEGSSVEPFVSPAETQRQIYILTYLSGGDDPPVAWIYRADMNAPFL